MPQAAASSTPAPTFCQPLSQMTADELKQVEAFLETLVFTEAAKRTGRDRRTVTTTVRRWTPTLRKLLREARREAREASACRRR